MSVPPSTVDITGAEFDCFIDAGCIQNPNRSNKTGQQAIESYRWLPDWVNKISLPTGTVHTKPYTGPSRYRKIALICSFVPPGDGIGFDFITSPSPVFTVQ